MALIQTTTKQDFEDKVINSDKTTLVDFWAEWCPPCRAMSPVLKNIAEDLGDDIDIIKVNIEESADNQSLAGQYQVQSIPNMIVFKDGKEVDRIIGMSAGETIKKKLVEA